MHMDAERMEHGSLYGERLDCALLVRSVRDVHVIGAVPRHEGVAGDTIEGGADHGPLDSSLLPAAFRLFRRQRDNRAETDIYVQPAGFHKGSAPDDLSRPADTLQRSAAKREI